MMTATMSHNLNKQDTPPLRQRLVAGGLAGLVAGLFCALAVNQVDPLLINLLTSIGLGLIFGAWFGPTIRTAGAGLVGGQALGLLWWLFGTLTLLPLLQGEGMAWLATDVERLFTTLVMQWVGLGALLGLLYYGILLWLLRRDPSPAPAPPVSAPKRRPRGQAIAPPLVQSLIIGGFSGVVGSWVFAWGVDRNAFYPIVAQLVGAESMMVGRLLHYGIGLVIGVSFGLLFQRDADRPGVGLLWGINYGLLWWIIGPLTLMPWLLGNWQPADWSLATAQRFVPSLIAHLLYGALVGYLVGLAGQLWEVLFVASDPLNRTREGAGVQSVQAILMGTAGGVVGGLLFTVVMAGVGALPRVAQLVGAQSSLVGLLVHLVISVLIGIGYGLLLQKQAQSYGAGLAWGMLYGFFWWVWGALTLFPLLLRQPPDWTLATVAGAYPSLIGHLLYGAGLGLFFHYLSQRYAILPGNGSAPQSAHPAATSRVASGVGTAALWAVTLALAVLLPLLLSAQQAGGSGY
jgi:uncharacterized membrane protein YagU involved in acid resistance